MSEFTEIILRLLWRFYPIAWLTTAIVRALARITAWLEDEQSWLQLAHSKEDCALVGGWLALAEERLNELITWKAMKLLQRPYHPPQPCGHHRVRAVRTPQDIYRRLCRLVALYHDHQRLYELRARKLRRLFDPSVIALHPVRLPAASPLVVVMMVVVVVVVMVATLFPAAGIPAQPIRAPPHRRTPDNPACPTGRPHRREREIMPEANDEAHCPLARRRMDFGPRFWSIAPSLPDCLKEPQ